MVLVTVLQTAYAQTAVETVESHREPIKTNKYRGAHGALLKNQEISDNEWRLLTFSQCCKR